MRSHVSDLAFPLIIKYLSNKMDNPVLRRTGYFFAAIAGAVTARNVYDRYKEEVESLSRLRKGPTGEQRKPLLALSAGRKGSSLL